MSAQAYTRVEICLHYCFNLCECAMSHYESPTVLFYIQEPCDSSALCCSRIHSSPDCSTPTIIYTSLASWKNLPSFFKSIQSFVSSKNITSEQILPHWALPRSASLSHRGVLTLPLRSRYLLCFHRERIAQGGLLKCDGTNMPGGGLKCLRCSFATAVSVNEGRQPYANASHSASLRLAVNLIKVQRGASTEGLPHFSAILHGRRWTIALTAGVTQLWQIHQSGWI